MSDISDSKKIAMANAVRQVKESNQRTLTMLKADRFLADADWDMAERDCDVHNPYMEVEAGAVRILEKRNIKHQGLVVPSPIKLTLGQRELWSRLHFM